MADLAGLTESIKKGKRKDAKALTEACINENVAAREILDALLAGMSDVGERFKKNEIFVPEVLIAARAMNTAMELLEPQLVDAGIKPEHKVVIGTVKGDLHDIGKNLVAMMLEGGGYDVIDLEVDVSPEDFVSTASEQDANVIALSALLTTTMPSMKDTVDALVEAGLKDQVKVVIGGAPVTQSYADEIGADGYAPDAASAVDKVAELLA